MLNYHNHLSKLQICIFSLLIAVVVETVLFVFCDDSDVEKRGSCILMLCTHIHRWRIEMQCHNIWVGMVNNRRESLDRRIFWPLSIYFDANDPADHDDWCWTDIIEPTNTWQRTANELGRQRHWTAIWFDFYTWAAAHLNWT